MPERIPLARPSWTSEMRQVAIDTLDSGHWVKGPQSRAFAQEFAEYCGVDFASPCNSGSGALIAALRLLGIGAGDEVIVPSLTFIATATSASMVGATPVFAEVESDYWCLDVEDVKRRITSQTKAVIGVHLFGQCYDSALIELCQERGLALIEDAAQAHGASILIDGQRKIAGALGTVSCFSFFPSKTIAVGGEGGMITSTDSGIGARIKSIVDHGRDGSLQSQEVGTNMRMSEVFAAIGRKQLAHLDMWLENRRKNAQRFSSILETHQALTAPSIRPNTKHAWHQYCIQTDSPEQFIEHMESHAIAARLVYPTPCHQHPVYSEHAQAKATFSITENLSKQLVSIPVHHGLTEEEVIRIFEALRSYS
ncbi:MAG: DegT/DnrJ/EryC1/StrS family aminotransferase [Candidatus Poseidoniaceae archaeon]|nr:DegT/DnrJ/EryC1/StrS family aminotransferase [Candidatus Poseidoniaceae archaeon]